MGEFEQLKLLGTEGKGKSGFAVRMRGLDGDDNDQSDNLVETFSGPSLHHRGDNHPSDINITLQRSWAIYLC